MVIKITNKLDGPNEGPKGSLRNAIFEANNSPLPQVHIKFVVDGKFELRFGELVTTKNIKLTNDSCGNVTITTVNVNRLLRVASGTKLEIENIRFKNGNTAVDGGAILVEQIDHELVLNCVVIKENNAQRGAGIFTNGRVVLKDSIITKNTAATQGGGIWALRDVISQCSSVCENKVATVSATNFAGGIFSYSGNVILTKSIIYKNQVSYTTGDGADGGFAGGVFVLFGNLITTDTEIVENTAFSHGGVIVALGNITSRQTLYDKNSSFDTAYGGGAIFVGSGEVKMTNSKITNNNSAGMVGSGIVSISGNVTIEESLISENTCQGPGGAIASNFNSALVINKSCIKKNNGSAIGGALVNFALGSIVVQDSDIEENSLNDIRTIGVVIATFIGLLVAIITKFIAAAGSSNISETPTILGLLNNLVVLVQTQGLQVQNLLGLGTTIAGGGIGTLLCQIVSVSSNINKNKVIPTGLNTGIGGGLYTLNELISVNDSDVSQNTSFSAGGGIHSRKQLVVNKSRISKNKVTGTSNGGGLYIDGTAVITSSKIIGNIVGGSGGGIYNAGNTVLVTSHVENNVAGINGGGVLNAGVFTDVDNKFAGNVPNNIA